jgi:hypothetical protein
VSVRAEQLADRVLSGASALADFAQSLTDAQWHSAILPDGRTAGVIVHHVASMYPIEVELARTLGRGEAITEVTWAAVAGINAAHATANATVDRPTALALLHTNSAAAAAGVRAFGDAELDGAAPLSLNGGAPLTAQFMIEAHCIGHSYHHLEKLRAALATR